MDTLFNDIRFALRMLSKDPIITAVCLLALALVGGINTSMFSIVNGVLLRSLNYPNPEQLLLLQESNPAVFEGPFRVSAASFLDWKNQTTIFQDMAAGNFASFNLTGQGDPEKLEAESVTSNLFRTLGIGAMKGRTFLDEEDQPNAQPVLVISHGFWQRRLGGRDDVLGKSLCLDDRNYTIVGIMPPDFLFPHRVPQAEVWVPLQVNDRFLMKRNDRILSVVARLKPGKTIEHARAELSMIAMRLSLQFPDTNSGWGVYAVKFQDSVVGEFHANLLILLAATGFLSLMASANIANLLLAHAFKRRREVAVRVALGASRLRVVRQFLIENVLLFLLGGTLSLLVAHESAGFFAASIPGMALWKHQIGIDYTVLAFTFGISLFSGLIFGLIPAIRASCPDMNELLKDTASTASGSRKSHGANRFLIVFEISLAMVLLIGAGLLIKSYVRLSQKRLGCDPRDVLTLRVELPDPKYREDERVAAFYHEAILNLQRIPQVTAAGIVDTALGSGIFTSSIFIESRQPSPSDSSLKVKTCVASRGYFAALGIPLLRGQLFAEEKQGPDVAVISEKLARRYWPNEDPIGKRVTYYDPRTGPWMTIAAVVGDVRQEEFREVSPGTIYEPYYQAFQGATTFVIRTQFDCRKLIPTAKSAIWEADKNLPIFQVMTMEDILSDSIAEPRYYMALLTCFGAMAVLLAGAGIYAIVAQYTRQRTREMAIRFAVGAADADIVRLLLKQGMALAWKGILAGVLLSLWLTRALANLLYGVSPTDPITICSAASFVVLMIAVASFIPARQAVRLNLVDSLRHD
jgi:putative ABC transport system permease protein